MASDGAPALRQSRPQPPDISSARAATRQTSPLTFRSRRSLRHALFGGVLEARRRNPVVDGFSVEQRRRARQEDVVESKVPDRRKGLSERHESAERSSNGTAETVVLSSEGFPTSEPTYPVVELVDSQRGCDEGGAEQRGDCQDHLPVCWAVVAHTFELGVEIEEQVDEAARV